MAYKYLLLFIVFSFANGESFHISDATYNELARAQTFNPFDLVNQLATALNTTLTAQYKLLQNATSYAQNVMQSSKTQFMNFTMSTLMNQMNSTMQMLTMLNSVTGNTSSSADNCTKAQQSAFASLPGKFLNYEMSCVTSEMNSGYTMLNDSINMGSSLFKTLQVIPSSISQCSSVSNTVSRLQCFLNLGMSIANQQVSLPQQLISLTSRATTFSTGIHGRITACAATSVMQSAFESSAIVFNISLCTLNQTLNAYAG